MLKNIKKFSWNFNLDNKEEQKPEEEQKISTKEDKSSKNENENKNESKKFDKIKNMFGSEDN